MSDRHYNGSNIGANRSSDNGGAGDAFSLDKMLREAAEAERLGGDPQKIWGMEMAPAEATMVKGLINSATHWITSKFATDGFRFTNDLLTKKIHVEPAIASKVAAVATFGAAVAVNGGAYFVNIYNTFNKHRDEKVKLARTIAPVLDELKGSHSVGALMRVGRTGQDETGNDMIWAHRKRLSTIAHSENIGNFIDLGLNAGANIAINSKMLVGVARGASADQLQTLAADTSDASKKAASGAPVSGPIGFITGTTAAGLSDIWKRKNTKKLESLPKHSALNMVLVLEEQVTNNANAHEFYPPGNKSRGMSLENYIAAVMVQHQKEMALFDPEQSEIRKELHEDLALVAKPMAKALREGTISAMSLVRLIGENHVIKSHGRVIASAAEVEAQIERMAGKATSRAHHDPKDYYGTASFTKDDLKAALKSLDGDERLMFASWFPDAVLEDAGISEKEIKQIREATKAVYEKGLLEAVSGLGALSDRELKDKGMATAEIRQLRDMVQRVAQKGGKAVHDIRQSPANPHGAEPLLANALVSGVVTGGKEHLGKLMESGREALAEAEAEHTSASDQSHDGDAEEADHAAGYRRGLKPKGSYVDRQSRVGRHDDGGVALSN